MIKFPYIATECPNQSSRVLSNGTNFSKKDPEVSKTYAEPLSKPLSSSFLDPATMNEPDIPTENANQSSRAPSGDKNFGFFVGF